METQSNKMEKHAEKIVLKDWSNLLKGIQIKKLGLAVNFTKFQFSIEMIENILILVELDYLSYNPNITIEVLKIL